MTVSRTILPKGKRSVPARMLKSSSGSLYKGICAAQYAGGRRILIAFW